ncbi:MAG TPA: hypothetical protein VM535_01030 [Candidatus Saccharimonadales bacterium]|nr:hypothetical protein [Candidatus Saccharimonadales bacterium]
MPQPPNNKKPPLTGPPSAPLSASPEAGRGRRDFWLGLAGWLLLAAVLTTLFINRQPLSDWWRLRGYQPPAAVQQLAVQDTMTDYAKHLFYLNRPRLVSSVESFRQGCPNSRDNIVLGCYHPNQEGIYIYDVKDSDLQGIAQVTAAHETLHAAYERLSDKDRQYVNGLLKDYYAHGLTDQRVQDEIKLYQKTEPDAVVDEMHSTFGTEVADLPPALQNYYKRYFTNRAAVVAFEKKYEQAFLSRQQVVQAADERLAVMRAEIDARRARLESQQEQLQASKSRLDSLLAAGQNEAYNASLSSYNAQVSAYNSGVAALRSYIEEYNRLVAERNKVAEQLNVLNQAVDTRQLPSAE